MTPSGPSSARELFDPYSVEAQHDPYPIYRVLRDEHPLYRNETRGFWAFSRYDDVADALNDHETFSSEGSLAVGGVDVSALLPMMIMMDPPRHDRLRTLVARAFTPRQILDLVPMVEALAEELVGRLLEDGGDLVGDLAGPLPIAVMARLLGIPDSDATEFRTCTEQFVQGDPASRELSRQALAGASALHERFEDLVRERRRSPRGDLVSELLAASVDGERLGHDEILGFCFLLVVAGTETSTNLLANGCVLLDEHPETQRVLASDRDLIPAAIEEMLRYDSPVQGLARTTRRDVERHGHTIPAGHQILLLFASANRDVRAFDLPDTFDIARRSHRSLAFGRGIHSCLGASLARFEARIVFEQLLARPSWLALDRERGQRLSSSFIRGYRSLPVEQAYP